MDVVGAAGGGGGGGGTLLAGDEGAGTGALGCLPAEPEPEPEPEPVPEPVPELELEAELEAEPVPVPVPVPEPVPVPVPDPVLEPDSNPAPPLNFPAKHCVINGTSTPPVGVKLNTYESAKLPAAHPTQPKKLAEFSFRKSNAAHTSVRQLALLLPPPVSDSSAWRFEVWSHLSSGWKALLMPLVVQVVEVPE